MPGIIPLYVSNFSKIPTLTAVVWHFTCLWKLEVLRKKDNSYSIAFKLMKFLKQYNIFISCLNWFENIPMWGTMKAL